MRLIICILFITSIVLAFFIIHTSTAMEQVGPILLETDHTQNIRERLKQIIVMSTTSCKSLNLHLKETPESLDWLADTAVTTLLKVAVDLEDLFGTNLLEILLKKGDH